MITICPADVVSPPTSWTPASSHSVLTPAAKPVAHSIGVDAGAARLITRPIGAAPIASASATQDATALRPTSSALDQSRRKCTPSTIVSVETARSPARRSTAQSSPTPSSTGPDATSPSVTRSIRANSPSSPIVCPGRPAGFGGEP